MSWKEEFEKIYNEEKTFAAIQGILYEVELKEKNEKTCSFVILKTKEEKTNMPIEMLCDKDGVSLILNTKLAKCC